MMKSSKESLENFARQLAAYMKISLQVKGLDRNIYLFFLAYAQCNQVSSDSDSH